MTTSAIHPGVHQRLKLAALGALTGVVILVLAACSAGSSPSPAPTGTPAAPTGTPAAPTGTPATGSTVQVEVMSSTFGDYLAGADGKALYVLTNDSTGTSTCVDECAQNWPPFTLAEGETTTAGAGVTGELGTLQRPDGSTQVSINGLPLYYFAGDTAAGDTNGQGINDVWFLASPAGGPLSAGAAASPGATPGDYTKPDAY